MPGHAPGQAPGGASASTPHAGHGGRVFEAARLLGCAPSAILDGSNNANSLVEDLTAGILANIPVEHRFYPDHACTALTQAMAGHEGVDTGQILPVHGSAEGIHLALLALRPRSVCIVAPTFSEYGRLCQVLGIEHAMHRLEPGRDFVFADADRQALLESNAECFILCSPNNPTGQNLPDLPALLAELAPRPVLVDVAYKEFLFGTPAMESHATAALLRANPQAICLLSLTKFFFCPGIRLGAVAAAPHLITPMAALQPPWSVTQLAQDAGVAFLEQIDAYRVRLPRLRELSRDYAAALRGVPGVAAVLENAVNYLLVRLSPGRQVAELAAGLAQKRILIRDCDAIPGMPPGYFRVQVRSREENLRVLETVTHILGTA